MPDSIVTDIPFVPVRPAITIGATGSSVEIACAAGELAVEVDQDETTTETYCGSFTTYKPEVWTITVTCFPSYGTDGLWTLVRPLCGTIQPFTVLPDAGAPVSEDNPLMSGTCIVKAFPFYTGAPGEPKSFDLELAVQGAPAFDIVPPAASTARESVAA